jgi:hypothetical protein
MNFFKKYPKLISIELNGMEVTVEMLENLTKFAPSDLKSIILRQCTFANDDCYDLLANFIGKYTKIESITFILPDLGGDHCDKILASMKENKHLMFFNFVVDSFSGKGAACLEEILSNSAESMLGLSLGIGKIDEKDKEDECYEKITKSLSKLKKIEKLELAFMFISEETFGQLSSSIGGFSQLRILKLYFGGLNDHNHIKLFERAEILQKSIESWKNVELFDISLNDFPHEVLQLIFAALAKLKKLKTLNVSGNTINGESAAVLADSLGENVSVTTLFANNCSIDDAAMSALFSKAENIPSLQYIYLKNNMIEKGGVSIPFSKMSDIVVVDFSGNQMGYDEVIAIADLATDSMNFIINFNNNSGIGEADDVEKSRRRDELEKMRLERKTKIAFFGV